MNWLEKLKDRWQLGSTARLIWVLLAFACTGTTVLFLKRPIVAYFSPDGEQNIWFTIIYLILILPIYNIILLFYGFLFGQFEFFWNFEKKSFKRLFGKKNDVSKG